MSEKLYFNIIIALDVDGKALKVGIKFAKMLGLKNVFLKQSTQVFEAVNQM